MVRGTFFATGGAGGAVAAGPFAAAASSFVCVWAIVLEPVGITAASSSSAVSRVSLFILSSFVKGFGKFAGSAPRPGQVADYKEPPRGRQKGSDERRAARDERVDFVRRRVRPSKACAPRRGGCRLLARHAAGVRATNRGSRKRSFANPPNAGACKPFQGQPHGCRPPKLFRPHAR